MSIIVGFSSLLLLLVAATPVVALDTSEMVKAPQKVIIDTDIGRYMDDYFSIAYMVGHHHTQWHVNQSSRSKDQITPPLIDIRLILTAYANTTGRAALVSLFLEKLGQAAEGIDIGIGLKTEATTNVTGHKGGVGPGYDWMEENDYGAAAFDAYPARNNASVYPNGIARLEHLLDTEATEEDPILILGIAPVINLGDLFGRRPELKRRVSLVMMGGSINIGYRVRTHPSAEDNIYTNLTASRIVYHTGGGSQWGNWTFPIYSAPLDSTELLQIYGQPYEQFLQGASLGFRGAATLLSAYKSWFHAGAICRAKIPSGLPCTPENTTPTLYDMQAGYMAIELVKSNNLEIAQGFNKTFSARSLPFLGLQYISHLQVNGTGFTIPCCPSTVVPAGRCATCQDADSWTGVHEALAWVGGVSGGLPVAFQEHAVEVLMGAPPPG